MKNKDFGGEVIYIDGREYSIYFEYDKEKEQFYGETYLDDKLITSTSKTSKEDLYKKIKNRLQMEMEIHEIEKMDEFGEIINKGIHDNAIDFIKEIDPLSKTSLLWEDDPGAPTFLGFAIQKNLPYIVDEMFKYINTKEKQSSIDREFYGLCLFNNKDLMWKIFLNNIEILNVTVKFGKESALDVLLNRDYYHRLEQIIPKLDEKETIIVKKAINKEYDHEYFKNVPLYLFIRGIYYKNSNK